MTRTELMKTVNEMYNNARPWRVTEKQVNTCNAYTIKIEGYDYVLLKSYNTIVGVFSEITDTMYVFDYYSQTTVSHIYKACKNLNALRITWLYKRSDNIIETGLKQYINTFKLTSKEMKKVCETDFRTYLESKVFI